MARHMRDIMAEVQDLNVKVQQILYKAEYENYDDLSGLEWDKTSADDLFLLDELRQIMYKLDDVSHTLKYLDRPIKTEGALHKNSNGRYEVNGIELSSGSGIEYLATDDRHMRYNDNDDYVPTPYWCASRIEHDGTDYYIVGANDLDTLENVRVRI
ncbi:MAG: DUF5348 domain-containing protein, partial [Lachnospiraceae bacterium]|nr:DUF5348 domain-containing protein [Lachnospiraceae bacterium]